VILATVVAFSSFGTYGEICRRDLLNIAMRFLPARNV
jgi:hypothetical protein